MGLVTNENFSRLLTYLEEQGSAAGQRGEDTGEYREFLAAYPLERLNSLTLDEYCLGKGDGASFCWWIERGLQSAFGRYMPGSARGHILYFQTDGSVYKHRFLADLADEAALHYVLKVLSTIASCNPDENPTWIDDDNEIYRRAGVEPRVTMGAGRKLRVLMCYHPDRILPVSSSDHLGHYLGVLGCPKQEIPPLNKPVARTLKLHEYYRKACESVPGISPYGFMRALYSEALGLAPEKEEQSSKVHSRELRFIPIRLRHGEQVDWNRATHIRLLGQTADTSKAQESLDFMAGHAGQDGVAAIADFEAEFPGRLRSSKGQLEAMRMDLRHFANSRESGSNPQDKGLIELGYLDHEVSSAEPQLAPNSIASNQILYGPPGTGKTYATIEAAMEVLDAESLLQHRKDRVALKLRFDELVNEGRIRFVTFHQSFSYEDFVEGIRASSADGRTQYQVESGIFKRICEDAASENAVSTDVGVDEVLQHFLERASREPVSLESSRGIGFSVTYRSGNTTLNCFPETTPGKDRHANIDLVRQLLQGKTSENADGYVQAIVDHLKSELANGLGLASSDYCRKPYVLIIDEINRGNVSRIFGELITLLEPSKRSGAAEALEVTLPYSRTRFSIPDNLFIIGTMNTADRSLAGLDIALRRRFVFREMPPRPELLDAVIVEGIRIDDLLTVMNQRIEVLLDRDHRLGHAYFMPLIRNPSLESLGLIFRNQVLPLLQEYFFEDWQRIQWVLNDHRKPDDDCFVYQPQVTIESLFGPAANVSSHNLPWRINESAFMRASAYIGVIDSDLVSLDVLGGQEA